jgi:DNA-binding NarL/FixJ family response regulator
LIRVLVSAKSAITRAGIESLVHSDPRFELVAEGYRAGDLLRMMADHDPDVVLLDSPETISSRSLLNLLHQPAAPALVLLVGEVSRAEIRRAFQSGFRSLLLRESKPEEILAALAAAAEGLAVVSPEILDALLPSLAEGDNANDLPSGEPLTSRESEILSLLAQGGGNKEIATRLHISEHTVKFHVSSILAKLGAATRTEAVTRGYRQGLIVM